MLLQLQATSFAAAPVRGRDALVRFESLALGLIPFATSDILVSVAQLLRRLPDPPARVLAAIDEKLGSILGLGGPPGELTPLERATRPDLDPATLADLVAIGSDAVDLALAGNAAIVMDGPALGLLVERASKRAPLATALLARQEPTLFDRAGLYRFADAGQRRQVRSALADGAARSHHLPPSLDWSEFAGLTQAASDEDPARFAHLLADALGLDGIFGPDPHDPAEAELAALALVSLGVEASDGIRMFLTLDVRIGRSVETVFGLAEILRATPRAVAYEVLYCSARQDRLTERRAMPRDAFQAADRVRRVSFGTRQLQSRPAGSVPPDRLSRATTGRDRT